MFEFIADFPGETVCNDNDPASGEQKDCAFCCVELVLTTDTR